ncbi:hypothetical protein PM082_021594 [Marasmius tenuissimus]|nr:hypothetical protein PM082_021594 [Marasmius tenuissimus]
MTTRQSLKEDKTLLCTPTKGYTMQPTTNVQEKEKEMHSVGRFGNMSLNIKGGKDMLIKANINVFGATFLNWARGNKDRALIVSTYGYGSHVNPKFRE